MWFHQRGTPMQMHTTEHCLGSWDHMQRYPCCRNPSQSALLSHHNVGELVFLQGLWEASRKPWQPEMSDTALQEWNSGLLLWPRHPRPEPDLPQLSTDTHVREKGHTQQALGRPCRGGTFPTTCPAPPKHEPKHSPSAGPKGECVHL